MTSFRKLCKIWWKVLVGQSNFWTFKLNASPFWKSEPNQMYVYTSEMYLLNFNNDYSNLSKWQKTSIYTNTLQKDMYYDTL